MRRKPNSAMADKKRKTLQIKRPNADSPLAKNKPLPKVNMDDKAATSSIDGDALSSMGPKAVKSSTTRIALPDEDKIRRARRANATQDLEREDAMPSAEQIEQAQNSATMPIMIDTESIEESATQKLSTGDTDDGMDQTMEIDPDSLATTNLETQLLDGDTDAGGDKTMQIDPEALRTRNLSQELEAADKTDKTGDQTLKIDEEELNESLASQKLEAAQNDSEDSDKTMQIDPAALQTGSIEGVEEVQGMETMKMETMQMDDDIDTEVTRQEMEESFNAQTMEMDPNQLADELAKASSKKVEISAKDGADKTMDLSQAQRPKTIMIKRPSKDGAGPSAPTVKAARPDAATIKASRPVTANRSAPKETTSRIDVPAGESEAGTAKEGKTIKLRRPTGAPAARSPSRMEGVAGRAGLVFNEDGTVTAMAKKEKPLGGAWLAVAIVTLLVSLAALWSIVAVSQPELPMPGRLVDVNQQLIQR